MFHPLLLAALLAPQAKKDLAADLCRFQVDNTLTVTVPGVSVIELANSALPRSVLASVK